MLKIRIHIEIKIEGEWFYFTPSECILLGISCPKYPSSVFSPENWEFTLLDNHFFIAAVTGRKNPHNLIPKIKGDHIISNSFPNDITNVLKEYIEVSERLGKILSNITCFNGSLFKDEDYWKSELYNGSMKLKYEDLIEDLPKWIEMVNSFEKEFDDFRFIFWIEED